MRRPFKRSLVQDGVVRSADNAALNLAPFRIAPISLGVPVEEDRGPKAVGRKLVGGSGCVGVSSLLRVSVVRVALSGLLLGFSAPVTIFCATLLLPLGRRHH